MQPRTGNSWRATGLFLRVVIVATAALLMASCGGTGGGPGPGGAGQGLVAVNFLQAGVGNVPLNTILEIRFSEPVSEPSVHPGSLQIREGSQNGNTVEGEFTVVGSIVYFEPKLPSLCDLSDSAFKPDTDYSVLCVGFPESFSIYNTAGQPLNETVSWSFTTRPSDDPNKFVDAIPGQAPQIIECTPNDGTPAVAIGSVADRQRIEIEFSENLDPCTIDTSTVQVEIYEVGGSYAASIDVGPRKSGFVTDGNDPTDQLEGDPTTWGSDTGSPWPGGVQTLPATVHLTQTFTETHVVVSPIFGQDPANPELGGIFPDNVLIVVTLSFEVTDFGGQPLTPFRMSFTTENLDGIPGTYLIENQGETPYDTGLTSADVDTARAPSRVQAYLLFAGDGDNGMHEDMPSLPETDASGCLVAFQPNDGSRDDFEPNGDILLDTGAFNSCANTTDGSSAVIWEFASFRIGPGVTVRLVGENPAIILVQGDVTIESGGRLLARGDGAGGSPRGAGRNGTSTTTNAAAGGTGVAGGGDGGTCLGGSGTGSARYSGSGFQGYFYTGSSLDASVGTNTGPGVGKGNTSVQWTSQTNPNNRNSPAGGGGGHADAGLTGAALGSGASPTKLDLTPDGAGGGTYGAATGRMPTPEAGSGGGAGGETRPFTGNVARGPGGGGGAGGGFIDITASGNILIFGTIDAAGSPGGNGATQPFNPNYSWQPGTGGGGGGSGGGIRLLTPLDVEVGATTLITAAGGIGGAGGQSQANQPPVNPGGNGGNGRVVIEDSDAVIKNEDVATIIPGEGQQGYFRGLFDPTRFAGGGLSPVAVTEPFPVGPFNPTYDEPDPGDFIVGSPPLASPGAGKVVVMIEAQSFDMRLDGEPEATGNGFRTIGYFEETGNPFAPQWFPGHPAAIPRPGDNIGNGLIDNMASMDGDEFLQIRITLFLASSVGPLDAGAYLDDWLIEFDSDN